MRTYRIIAGLCLLALIILIQVTLLESYNIAWLNINALLLLGVLLLFTTDPRWALATLVGGGLILDLYSALPFGLFAVIGLLTILVLSLLLAHVITNRSLYGLLVMTAVGTLVYHGLFLIGSGLLYSIGWTEFAPTFGYWHNVVEQLVMHSVIVGVVFWPINALSRRFKPMFLPS